MTGNVLPLARDWPGKSNPAGEHPAVWHMLDVAACAERLIDGHRTLGVLPRPWRRALTVLAALHDVGKISETFRAVIRERRPGAYRHWKLSDTLLTGPLDSILGPVFGSDIHVRGELYAAVSGHHGGPERSNDRRELARRRKAIGTEAEEAAVQWTTLLLDMLPDGSLEGLDQTTARRLSWLLSGLTVAADWVGSNVEWFGPALPDVTPADYLQRARDQASYAVTQAGLSAKLAAIGKDARALTELADLRPMQGAVEAVVLPDGPVLALIEDMTGAGKTEAALILAHRMIGSEKANGLFFALPTMATANAMFGRMTAAATRLFMAPPSLTLVHGRAGVHEGFRALVGAEDDETPEAGCTRWLADDRRRALLADVGIGTIDQALLSILPTRFATLRLFGLTNRILIVDEAHAYDPYMQRQLETLLRMQALSGGSAIVMTATLPLGMRQAYANAFRDGLSCEPVSLSCGAYPAMAIVGGKTVHQRSVEPAPAAHRMVRVVRVDSAEKAIDCLLANAHADAACLWVRNAVDDAIAAVEKLRALGCPASLLHARFALGDRLRHEAAAMKNFGRDGIGRAGQVLVATQVVEASLDLDFDAMVSDLAPIGALVQRAGRLWRHMDRRRAEERPVSGPTLTVLSLDPDQVTDARWLNNVLGRGARVYRHDHQWLTARAIFDAHAISEPDGVRALIEAVHGQDVPDLPEPLARSSQEAEGATQAEVALAQQNVVDPRAGYLRGTGDAVWSDERFPTRLGVEETTLVLARREGGRLQPWCDADTLSRAWVLSEVRCAKWRLDHLPCGLPDQSAPEVCEVKAAWAQGKRDYLILCQVFEGGVICEGLRYDPEWGLLFSS